MIEDPVEKMLDAMQGEIRKGTILFRSMMVMKFEVEITITKRNDRGLRAITDSWTKSFSNLEEAQDYIRESGCKEVWDIA